MRSEAGSTLVSVRGLSKKYCRSLRRPLLYGVQDIGGEWTRQRSNATLRRDEFWAIEDVSFELQRGESLAVIGVNGAGKSTLLKILTGLVKPDAGEARLRGRVGSIIELGTGLNPVLSGRENIDVYGAICGFTKKEIEPLIEQIIEFAELQDALETPLKYYSSGMKARLAFAVTSFMKPDVLLVDEVLAVGDINFQRKCVNRMLTYLEDGGSLILVSHSPFQIQSICRRGLLLENGRVAFCGSATETLGRYFESRYRTASQQNESTPVPSEVQPVVITRAAIEAENGGDLQTAAAARVTLGYHALRATEAFWGFSIWTGDGWVCITGDYHLCAQTLAAGEGELSCRIPSLPLLAGTYLLKAALIEPRSLQVWDALGWSGAPGVLTVRTPPSTLNNIFAGTNQEMTIDVEWQ